jgi:hypothetical protein
LREIVKEANSVTSQECVREWCTDVVLQTFERVPCHVTRDLHPKAASSATPEADQPARSNAHLGHQLEMVTESKRYALEQSSIDMCPRVLQSQSENQSTSLAIEDRTALSTEIGQDDQSV